MEPARDPDLLGVMDVAARCRARRGGLDLDVAAYHEAAGLPGEADAVPTDHHAVAQHQEVELAVGRKHRASPAAGPGNSIPTAATTIVIPSSRNPRFSMHPFRRGPL